MRVGVGGLGEPGLYIRETIMSPHGARKWPSGYGDELKTRYQLMSWVRTPLCAAGDGALIPIWSIG